MILPSFNDLFPEQLAVYEQSADSSILVVGPPGSGKTSMAIWRARFIASMEGGRSVVIVTRNRLLASVASQLAEEEGSGSVTAVTMNSFIAGDYYQRFGQYAPQHAPFNYVWDQIIAEYAAAEIGPQIDHLIVDEGQNLPLDFFIWASQFGAKTMSVFADEDQATLGIGTKISDLTAIGFTSILPLVYNHRNTQPIVDVMETFHIDRVLPPAKVSRRDSRDQPRLIASISWESLADTVAARLLNRGDSIGVVVFKKDEVNYLTGLLRARLPERRVDFYTSDAEPGAEAAIRIRQSGVTVISGESAIGLEFDTLYLQDISRSLPVIEPIQNRRMYMLCARARDNLVLVNGPVQLSDNQLTALPNPPILER